MVEAVDETSKEEFQDRGHEANDRAIQFERDMSSPQFAANVGEAELMYYLMDVRTDFESALMENSIHPMPNKSYEQMYRGFLDETNKAINGDKTDRATYCQDHAAVLARLANSERESGTVFSRKMAEEYNSASQNWSTLASRLGGKN